MVVAQAWGGKQGSVRVGQAAGRPCRVKVGKYPKSKVTTDQTGKEGLMESSRVEKDRSCILCPFPVFLCSALLLRVPPRSRAD